MIIKTCDKCNNDTDKLIVLELAGKKYELCVKCAGKVTAWLFQSNSSKINKHMEVK